MRLPFVLISLRHVALLLPLACGMWLPLPACALTQAQALQLVDGDTDTRITALMTLAASHDERTLALIRALSNDAVQRQGDQVVIVDGSRVTDAVAGTEVPLSDAAEAVVVNTRFKSALDGALANLDLTSTDARRQKDAALTLQQMAFDDPNPAQLPLIDQALSAPAVDGLPAAAREALQLAQAALWIRQGDAAQRKAAALRLGAARQPAIKTLLLQALRDETAPAVQAALRLSLSTVERSLAIGAALDELFTGVSLGSILLLAALGLAITYGLMGVINMAHGELIMVGAYATYVVQGLFRHYLPGAFNAYLLAALPVAFLASALVGAAMERCVIRFLYGRPLETLLATWGISLVLIQGVRSLFGAQNVEVENPSWMSGSVTLMGNLTLPWNRILIIAFALFVLLAVSWLIGRTRLGLFVRGVTQNRPIAACMGVNTARTDTVAFALGSGIAGLAGAALSQIGNVGPDLGQNYIVDSFMVVVLGGVGQLAGTVYAALGLGVLNKLLEGWTGAVLAKIAVLVFIIVFIQKRPQGIFAVKGRSA